MSLLGWLDGDGNGGGWDFPGWDEIQTDVDQLYQLTNQFLLRCNKGLFQSCHFRELCVVIFLVFHRLPFLLAIWI